MEYLSAERRPAEPNTECVLAETAYLLPTPLEGRIYYVSVEDTPFLMGRLQIRPRCTHTTQYGQLDALPRPTRG